jgi:two-component system, OmpR family, response regulator
MRILIVEDEHHLANSIAQGLRMEKYAVDVAYDGEEGYDMASGEEYDLIILDRMIPKMDGVTLCRTLRKEKNHTPILMLTAKNQTEDKVAGLDSGADDYLTKPFSFEEFLARIRALVRRPQKTLSQTLHVGDLSLNPSTFVVERDGAPVRLSSREFSLLEYLMRNAGIILKKEQIMTHVWDYDSDILPNTVEVFIKNLRNKIDAPFHKKKALISTVRGFGYKIG